MVGIQVTYGALQLLPLYIKYHMIRKENPVLVHLPSRRRHIHSDTTHGKLCTGANQGCYIFIFMQLVFRLGAAEKITITVTVYFITFTIPAPAFFPLLFLFELV